MCRIASSPIVFVTVVGAALTVWGQPYPRAGAKAVLSTFYHQVSGTATIVNANSIRVDHFYYDGGGPAVYFYLGTNRTASAFANGIYFTNLLSGTVYTDATVTVTLPGALTLDGYNSLSVWCRDFAIDFGSGTFQPHLGMVSRTNGVTALSASGAVGEAYQLQASTNGVTWTNLAVKTNTSGTASFSDTNAVAHRFYRVQVQ